MQLLLGYHVDRDSTHASCFEYRHRTAFSLLLRTPATGGTEYVASRGSALGSWNVVRGLRAPCYRDDSAVDGYGKLSGVLGGVWVCCCLRW